MYIYEIINIIKYVKPYILNTNETHMYMQQTFKQNNLDIQC